MSTGEQGQTDTAHASPQSLNEAVNILTDSFNAKLRKHINSDDTAGAKAALRSYINQLEGLYRQLS